MGFFLKKNMGFDGTYSWFMGLKWVFSFNNQGLWYIYRTSVRGFWTKSSNGSSKVQKMDFAWFWLNLDGHTGNHYNEGFALTGNLNGKNSSQKDPKGGFERQTCELNQPHIRYHPVFYQQKCCGYDGIWSVSCLVISRYSKSICSRGNEHHEEMIFEMMGSGTLNAWQCLAWERDSFQP